MVREQVWSIGIQGGGSPLQLAPLMGVRNPVLTGMDVTDIAADFVADPFLLRGENEWHLFFEIGNKEQDRIGWATSPNLRDWTYRQVVLCPPGVRLSYPHVFRHESAFYMIPESHVAGEARLYRAVDFPRAWELDTVLLREPFIVDCSPFQHGGRWWMFANGGPPVNNNTLDLYFADDLRGPWVKHPRSPLNTDVSEARPAGRVIHFDNRIFRLGQDCGPAYGTAVRAFEVLELSETRYAERRIDAPLLGPSGEGWNADGMHHLDAHRIDDGSWVAAVDGFCYG
jgi:hypothetical protein